jgi:hypothetical protein
MLLEALNTVLSMFISLFWPFNTFSSLSYYNRIRAVLAGKSLFVAKINNETRIFYSKDLKQARSKFTRHDVEYLFI